jgi:hypothetical protein
LIEERVTVLEIVSYDFRLRREAYLRHGSSEDDHFVKLSNTSHEIVHTWTLDDVDVVILAFDFHRDCEVGLMENLGEVRLKRLLLVVRLYLETAVDQRFIEIQNKAFAAFQLWFYGRK